MKTFALFLFACCLSGSACVAAASETYTIAEIQPPLKSNAVAVVRLNDTKLTLTKTNGVDYVEHVVISVLQHEGDTLSVIRIPSGKSASLKSFKATLFDSYGKVIRDFSNKDMDHLNTARDFETWHLNKTAAPYTIEYEFEWTSENSLVLPDWRPVAFENVSLEKGKFLLTHESKTKINFSVQNIVEKAHAKGNTTTWALENLNALNPEPYSGSLIHLLPAVQISPEVFYLNGNEGSEKTWNDLGKFVYSQNEGKDVIEKINDPVLNTICTAQEPALEKAEEIYKYVQDNMSSDQGGGNPENVQDVNLTLSNKHGGCNALTLLMEGLLKYVGIESYCALIYAGPDNQMVKEDFPVYRFNSEVLCIPQSTDTFWLDCTSRFNAFNYLDYPTANRPCLILGKDGGVWSHVPVFYSEKTNILKSRLDYHLAVVDSEFIVAHIDLQGALQQNLRAALALNDSKKTRAAINIDLGLTNNQITGYKVEDVSADRPDIVLTLEINGQSTGKKDARELALTTNLLKSLAAVPAKTSEARRLPIVIDEGFDLIDSSVYYLPPGYSPENFMAGGFKENEGDFGLDKNEIVWDKNANVIVLKREFILKQGVYPASKFDDFYNFMINAQDTYMPSLTLRKM